MWPEPSTKLRLWTGSAGTSSLAAVSSCPVLHPTLIPRLEPG